MDAELLLGRILGCSRTLLQTRWHQPLEEADAIAFSALVKRRASREPLAYILGERPFYDVVLQVNSDVLVPRPETEHLVEEALRWAERQSRRLRIVDVGTGSGAIAITMAKHLTGHRILATDISRQALQVAWDNARQLGLGARIDFLQVDLLTGLNGPFDLIIANLPYVDRDELSTLMPEVRIFEPRLALDGGPGGLKLVDRLLKQLSDRLAPRGLALLELDPRQFDAAISLAQQVLPCTQLCRIADLAGHDRVLRLARQGESDE